MTRIASVSYVRAHLPEMVASLRKNKCGRVIITRMNGLNDWSNTKTSSNDLSHLEPL